MSLPQNQPQQVPADLALAIELHRDVRRAASSELNSWSAPNIRFTHAVNTQMPPPGFEVVPDFYNKSFNGQHPLGLPSTLEWPSLAGWYDENSTFLPPGQAHVSAFVYAYAQLSGAPPFLDTNGINQPQPPRVRRVRPPPGFEVASGYMYSTNELLMEPEISTRPVRTLMRPPPGFGFSPASRPVQIASGSPTGLRPSSRSRYNIQIRPPPGLGFSPRSRPRQFASGPPPGFENAPRSRKPTNIPAPGCCLTIAYRPAERKHPAGEQARLCSSPDFARREGDKPPGVSASLNAQTALESVSQVEVDRPEYSNLGVLLQYGRRSTKLQARGAARRAGREALRQEMEREDDEAQEARGESVESMGDPPRFSLPYES